jgi:aryl-alcohol dehydrogenase-like predicted oxidoreductase
VTELPKRALGRTGLEVTTLGYGAMELRGAPGGPRISDAAAEEIINAVC